MDARQSVQEASLDGSPLDERSGSARLMEQGEERGLRPVPAEHLQAFLTAAHAGQPIVDQHDASIALRLHANVSHGPAWHPPKLSRETESLSETLRRAKIAW